MYTATERSLSLRCPLSTLPSCAGNGSVVIAAITSCTNTSNPAVMLAAGLVAQKANSLGLKVKPWVKTSLAPGSKVVTEYLNKANLSTELNNLGFNTVGYGCTTCIGNSGPLPENVTAAINTDKLTVAAVLSGNRNFEGRVHPLVKNAYLASPPLVVAYALAGTMNIDLYNEPLGTDNNSNDVFLKDIWPSNSEVQQIVRDSLQQEMFTNEYAAVFDGSTEWQQLPAANSKLYAWDTKSSYVQHPDFFKNMQKEPDALVDVQDARVLALLGDSVTTDHISPAGNIAVHSPAGKYLADLGIEPKDFNSYGSRRGNHEVMVRGTFANIRLRNLLAPGTEGSVTKHLPSNQEMSIFAAATKYQADNTPLVILAGKEYGTGSSRDWAAKGTALLGVKAVIATSFERIHRSNLIGMGVLPLEFISGTDIASLELTGSEIFAIPVSKISPQGTITVTATATSGHTTSFEALIRIDTPKELEYFQHGGILHYVLRQLAK
ncbi:MAG: hypothetical protein COC15_03565 [Legionellales bacterium]|nr:MAG: hypothetical protein COC15_03565 [Legionellales bacterium]